MAMKDGYRFIFQMNDKAGHDELLEYTLQYRFTSERSHHTYIVRVERYIEHNAQIPCLSSVCIIGCR